MAAAGALNSQFSTMSAMLGLGMRGTVQAAPLLAHVPRPLARQRTCAAAGRNSAPGGAAAPLASVVPLLLPALSAHAEEQGVAAAAAQVVVAADPTEAVIGVLFTVAVAALVVLSGGVIYLSTVSWLDSRTETDDRQRIQSRGGNSPSRPGSGRSGGSSSDDEAPAKKSPQAPSTAKGFGSAPAAKKK